MERMNPKKLNVADIRNIIRLEENEINGPTYQDYKKKQKLSYDLRMPRFKHPDLRILPMIGRMARENNL